MIVVMALSGRALQASAESGILPKFFAKTNKNTNIPVNAQLVVILVVGIVAAFPSFTNLIVNLGALCNAVVVAIVCLTVIAARKKNPDVKDIFKAPGGNALTNNYIYRNNSSIHTGNYFRRLAALGMDSRLLCNRLDNIFNWYKKKRSLIKTI